MFSGEQSIELLHGDPRHRTVYGNAQKEYHSESAVEWPGSHGDATWVGGVPLGLLLLLQ